MRSFSIRRITRDRRWRLGLGAVLLLALLAVAASAAAAELVSDDVYHLPAGEVVQDDLLVFAREIIVDGTVEGDLIAFGQFITVNGIVRYDVIAGGAEVQINGIVEDDVRAGGAAVRIEGRIGDDLMAAGGSYIPGFGAVVMPMGDRTVLSGLTTAPDAVIGGDAYLAGGAVSLDGEYRNDLFAGAAQLLFNAAVQGNAVLEAGDLTFGDSYSVAGDLTYSARSQSDDPDAGGSVTKTEPEAERAAGRGQEKDPVAGFGWWLMRTLLIIAGIVLLGIVLLMLSGRTLTEPADAIQQNPVWSGLWGVGVAVAVIPLSAALVFLAGLFFGWFWGSVAAFAFFVGFWMLTWVLSPAVTGLALGRQILEWTNSESSDLLALVVGVSIIVFAGRALSAIPCAGVLAYLLIYLLSFALAAGGVILSRRGWNMADA